MFTMSGQAALPPAAVQTLTAHLQIDQAVVELERRRIAAHIDKACKAWPDEPLVYAALRALAEDVREGAY